MKKMSSLYSLLVASAVYASPFAVVAEQQSLEGKVASEIPEINERNISDSLSRHIANNIKEIKRLLTEAQDKKVDLSKEYTRGSSEERLRTDLVLETRSLTWFTIEALRNFEYRKEFTEPILAALHTTEEAFKNHACKYPLVGRQKVVVQLLAGREPLLGKDIELIYHKILKDIAKNVRQGLKGIEGYAIPQNYQKLLGETIESWEHWSNNYTRLDEISLNRSDAVPLEYREEHKKVARR